MSESQSKSAKKNARRKAAKHKEKVATYKPSSSKKMTHSDILRKLKEELEHSKLDQDHARSGKLRDQIWVLTDLVAGVRTDIDKSEMLEILQSINTSHSEGSSTDQSQPSNPTLAASNLTTEEKKIRTLKKKLQQIEMLKEREKKGEKLEVSQVDKIKSEEQIREEIEELEELLESVAISH